MIQNQENPSEIPGNRAGRSIKLTEVQRITDYEDDFVFKMIRGIKVAEDGSIFIRGTIQILKFRSDGTYVKNFIKRGEGPGEIKYLSDFVLSKDNILVGSILPVKLISFSQSGALNSELTVQGLSTFATLFEHFQRKSYFVSTDLFMKSIVRVIKTIFDPEIPVDIYELGLIYDVFVNEDLDVKILMTLTTPNCPVAETLPLEVEEKIKSIDEVKSAFVEITFDPPWSQELMSEEAKLELGML